MLNILITGGTGLVGTQLMHHLLAKGYQVGILSRRLIKLKNVKTFLWDDQQIDLEALRFADIIIHLAGVSVGDKRWTKKRKELIIASRINTAELIRTSLVKNNIAIDAFISASAVGYYGESGDRIVTESDLTVTPDFLSSVCQKWEEQTNLFASICRTASVRIGFVVDKKADGFNKLVQPIRLGIGSAIGTGKQYMSWIDLDDLVRLFTYVIEHQNLQGPINGCSPEAITNKVLSREVADYFNKPFFMPNVPQFVLRILLGEMGNLALVGNRVYPKKILDAGFKFKYPTFSETLEHSYSK